MSIMNRSASIEFMSARAMSTIGADFVASGHDDGLCHDHHWAREVHVERQAYPRVADASAISTPSSTMHDDIHYAS